MIEWSVSAEIIPYTSAVEFMAARAQAIYLGEANELIWLVEHPPLYTAGTSAKSDDLIEDTRFDVYQTERGGQYTYHGPGQRVVYVMLDLRRIGRDVSGFVHKLETWVISALAHYGLAGRTHPDRVGVWVPTAGTDQNSQREDKIAAIGIRLRRWISFHGISINISPDLEHFSGIIPCGIDAPNLGVTSFQALGLNTDMAIFDATLMQSVVKVFGDQPTSIAPISIKVSD